MSANSRPQPSQPIPPAPGVTPKPGRIAAIDWMRGFVMILMVVDHVSMAYHAEHLSRDSASLYQPGAALTDFSFFTRWISHICAPTFVFLAGTALAISVGRKVSKGVPALEIDKDIFYRGAFIALLDPTIISLFSGRLTFQVLYAIGVSFMVMALLRHLSTRWLIILALLWLGAGEWFTLLFWEGEKSGSILAAFFVSTYSNPDYTYPLLSILPWGPGLVIKYPLLPWLAMMILGWVFGRYVLDYRDGKAKMGPFKVLLISGFLCLGTYALTSYFNGYGNMLMWSYHTTNPWVQWLNVSKYPPSLAYTTLELGLMFVILALFLVLERRVGVRKNGVLLVFGQTAMFFYLVHRLFLEGTATYLGLRGFFENIWWVYVVSAALLAVLYPMCRWYRDYKKKHPNALWAKYI